MRRDDAKLAPVGKSITRLPPQSEAAGTQSGSQLAEERVRHNEVSIPAGHESDLDWCKAEVARLVGLLEERDRMVRSLRAEVKEAHESRDALHQELTEARQELERWCGGTPSPALSRSLPSVPRSWQPHRHDAVAEARAEAVGHSGSAQLSSSRSSERPVEIRVSVPRALTPDEVLEEASREEQRTVLPVRSVRSLAQAVVRMPSAPHPLTFHSGSLAVSVAAPASGATTRLLTAQSARAPSTAVVPSTVAPAVHKVISYRR